MRKKSGLRERERTRSNVCMLFSARTSVRRARLLGNPKKAFNFISCRIYVIDFVDWLVRFHVSSQGRESQIYIFFACFFPYLFGMFRVAVCVYMFVCMFFSSLSFAQFPLKINLRFFSRSFVPISSFITFFPQIGNVLIMHRSFKFVAFIFRN